MDKALLNKNAPYEKSAEVQADTQPPVLRSEFAPSSQTADRTRAAGRPNSKQLHRSIEVAIAVICLLVLLEAAARIMVVLNNPPSFGDREFDIKYHMALRGPASKAKPELFFLGTSHIFAGVYPELLVSSLAAKHLQFDALNLAVSMALPENQCRLLEAAIKSGHKPAAVFYEISPLAASDEADRAVENYFLKSSYCGSYTFFPSKDPWEKLFEMAERHIYLLRYRTFFKAMLLGAPRTVLSPDSKLDSSTYEEVHNEISPMGWAPYYSTLDQSRVQSSIAKRRQYFGTKRNLLDGNSIEKLVDRMQLIQDICAARRIPLFLVWTPERAECAVVYKEMLNITPEQFTSRVSDVCAKRKMQMLDLHNSVSEFEHFSDCDHLNAAGAIELTNTLSKEIPTRLNQSLK